MTSAQLETKSGAKAFIATLSDQARRMMLLSLAETVCEPVEKIVPPVLSEEDIERINASIRRNERGETAEAIMNELERELLGKSSTR
jgi:hypothetical protein